VRCRTILILCVLIAAAAPPTRAADVTIEPALSVSEEYNDNVNLHPYDERTDYITRVIPSIHAVYFAPLWDWDVAYAYEYRYYARETTQVDATQRLNLLSRTRIIPDFFLLDIKDEYSTVSLISTKDYSKYAPLADQYLTEQNIFTVNPYLLFRPGTRSELATGYEYRNVWYAEERAIDKSVHAGYFDLAHQLTERLKMTATARHEKTDSTRTDFTHSTFLIGPRFEYRDRSVVWCRLGASKFSGFELDQATRPIWDVGILHSTPTASIRYESGRTWIDDPLLILRREDRYILSASRDVQRTSLGGSLAYREYGNGPYSDERKYSSMVYFSHYLTEKVQALYSVTIDRYERYPVRSSNTTTIAYLTDVRLDYRANETLTYSFDYQYADSYSDVPLDNYENNRISVAVKKIF
jgi:hypothetical protein